MFAILFLYQVLVLYLINSSLQIHPFVFLFYSFFFPFLFFSRSSIIPYIPFLTFRPFHPILVNTSHPLFSCADLDCPNSAANSWRPNADSRDLHESSSSGQAGIKRDSWRGMVGPEPVSPGGEPCLRPWPADGGRCVVATNGFRRQLTQNFSFHPLLNGWFSPGSSEEGYGGVAEGG